ncbi:MAG: acyl carrier protein [Bacteroidales bacterium]|nr:MAG: acyl carrier protein [Bacteroidales bacterium]
MQREKMIKTINDFLIDEIEIEKNRIKPTALLKKDLGIDSLDFVDVAVVIEKNFGLKIKGEEMTNVKTLQDFYDFIYHRIRG